jgi:hypothetical protein
MEAADRDTLDRLPTRFLESVCWVFRGTQFTDRTAFEAAVRDAQFPEWGEVWRPAEIVLRVPRVRIRPDADWYPSDREPEVVLTADDGESFSAGELLFKVHNALVADLQELHHQFFEGFSLSGHQEPGQPPLYDMDLGS